MFGGIGLGVLLVTTLCAYLSHIYARQGEAEVQEEAPAEEEGPKERGCLQVAHFANRPASIFDDCCGTNCAKAQPEPEDAPGRLQHQEIAKKHFAKWADISASFFITVFGLLVVMYCD